MYELVKAILEDHEELKSLLKQLERAGENNPQARERIFNRLETTLARHIREVEQFLYRPMEKNPSLQQDIHAGYREHRALETLMTDLKPVSTRDPGWGLDLETIRSVLLEHLDKGETRLLPRMEREIDPSELQNLGAQLLRSRARLAA